VNRISDPASYVGRFWVDSITHNADALRFLLALMGPERIAYGTDFPFPLGDLEHGRFIEDMADLSPTVKDQLMSGTLLEFLNLNEQDYQRPTIQAVDTQNDIFE
jgi:aminocarboxymuconate-semialdehyde decarboxylase